MASSAISAHICPEVYNPQGLNGLQGTNGVYNPHDKAAIATLLKVSKRGGSESETVRRFEVEPKLTFLFLNITAGDHPH